MADQLEPSGVRWRWHERSIVRRYDAEVDEWRDDDGNETGLKFGASFAYMPAESESDDPAAALVVMTRAELQEPRTSASLGLSVKFNFAGRHTLSRDEASQFIKSEGVNYALGCLRGALGDITRSVGLPAALIPTGLPDGVFDSVDEALADQF